MNRALGLVALSFALSFGGAAAANQRAQQGTPPAGLRGKGLVAKQITGAKPKIVRPTQKIFLSLGGEGEVQIPGVKVLDINLMDDHPDGGYVLRKGFEKMKKNPLVRADMTKMPFREGFADGIIGNRVPFQAEFAKKVAKESFRVLKPGAKVKLFSMSGGPQGWRRFLDEAGFIDVHNEGGQMIGTKPAAQPGDQPSKQ